MGGEAASRGPAMLRHHADSWPGCSSPGLQAPSVPGLEAGLSGQPSSSPNPQPSPSVLGLPWAPPLGARIGGCPSRGASVFCPHQPRAAGAPAHLQPGLAAPRPPTFAPWRSALAWHLPQHRGPSPSSATNWLGCLCQKGSLLESLGAAPLCWLPSHQSGPSTGCEPEGSAVQTHLDPAGWRVRTCVGWSSPRSWRHHHGTLPSNTTIYSELMVKVRPAPPPLPGLLPGVGGRMDDRPSYCEPVLGHRLPGSSKL